MKKWISITAGFVLVLIIVCVSSLYIYYWEHTPKTLRIEAGTTQRFLLSVPASGEIVDAVGKKKIGEVFLTNPVVMKAGMGESYYEVALKLYGILPFKTVSIEVVNELSVWPVGKVYGFYLETEGILVIGTGDFLNETKERVKPVGNLIREGDYLLKINGNPIENKQQFQKIVKESNGQELFIEGKRDEKIFTASIIPEKFEGGEYKLGIWVRDNAQGVGTVTYVDSSGHFGALGHPITDQDTDEILQIASGRLYDAQILSIQKGGKNEVGEIHGMIDYNKKYIEGILESNSKDGIYGISDALIEAEQGHVSFAIGMRQEVHKGEALIMSDISGSLETYTVRITDVDMEDHSNQALSILVTDRRLLTLTGGIVQGMSGCPILQDGKLVGAITHVLISDSKKGYGIYIEDMLE